jgi:uncharacterized protein YdaU (DUF1376 family)
MARKADSHHVLPLFCDDLIASCVDMTPACFGAYMRVLCYAWTRGGVPDDEAACCRITGGMEPGDWAAIRSRLTVLEDGRLSHPRLELERQAVTEIREQRSEAGRIGNAARWGSQTHRKRIANASQTDRKSIAPNPSPSLPSSENTHTAREAESEWRKPGWAATEWAAFVAVWNATERAAKWTPLTPPDGWVDSAATPGWLDKAREAVKRLPGCRHFESPLAVTQLLKDGFADRIIAGEFNSPKKRKQSGPDFGDSPPPPKAFTGEVAEAFDRTRRKLAGAKEGT